VEAHSFRAESLTRRKWPEYFCVVLWKIGKGWEVVYVEDFPWTWMIEQEPKAMGGRGLPAQESRRRHPKMPRALSTTEREESP